ncbi:uncharacterized protein T551_01872 [Pneumocystis jirovecii RU7]|uniref:Sorting nexin MVP1 n=1 Tax=Pneumocystis jirovecii (strain RU7) TaxID=1408657 RepID=A0A0W4ZNG0_PNEJ7|nr:uncharacterized protein T551_01872 [Pneumocystis jirovecii RU7]KTW29928.1 hypothetical protein T551_01872 [Pneumocystis jirovecii RU7]
MSLLSENDCFVKTIKNFNKRPYLFRKASLEDEVTKNDGMLLSYVQKKKIDQQSKKHLLDDRDVPFVYHEMFDLLNKSNGMTYNTLRKTVESSGLPHHVIERIINIMFLRINEDTLISRHHFYLVFALVGISQNGEYPSIETLEKYKNNLPIPKFQNINNSQLVLSYDKILEINNFLSEFILNSKQILSSSPSLEGTNNIQEHMSVYINNVSGPNAYPLVTSNFWNFNFIIDNVFKDNRERSFLYNIFNILNPKQVLFSVDRINIQLVSKKEGFLLFKHINYILFSVIRNSRVIRRYSDFLWLQECLIKKYPFRQVPLMPPKCFSVNGHYLSVDSAFLERRRRGLSRFINAVVRHPVFRDDPLVIAFLTVPSELSLWKKQFVLTIRDEFEDKVMDDDLGLNFPSSFDEIIVNIRKTINFQIDNYIQLCLIVERLLKYQEGSFIILFSLILINIESATEMMLFSLLINDFISHINQGISVVSKHFLTAQELLEEEAKVLNEEILEDLKCQRDGLIAIKNMFDRKDRLDIDNISFLEKRVDNNLDKLSSLNVKVGMNLLDKEKIEKFIMKDKELIATQKSRRFLVNKCILTEIIYFQISQIYIGKLYKDYAQERIKYTELLAENWRSMEIQIASMPSAFI